MGRLVWAVCLVLASLGGVRSNGMRGTCLDPITKKLPLCGDYVTFPYTSPYPETDDITTHSLAVAWAAAVAEFTAHGQGCTGEVINLLCTVMFEMCNAEQEEFPSIPHTLEYCGHQEEGTREDSRDPVEICEINADGTEQLLCGPAPWNGGEKVCIETKGCNLKEGVAADATSVGSTLSTYKYRGQQIQLGGKVTGLNGCDKAVNMLSTECWKWEDENNPHCVEYKATDTFVPVYSTVAHEWMAPGTSCSAADNVTPPRVSSTQHDSSDTAATFPVTFITTTSATAIVSTTTSSSVTAIASTEGGASKGDAAAAAAAAKGDVHSAYWPLFAIVLGVVFTGWAMQHTYKTHPLRMRGNSDLIGCLRVYIPALRRGETYRRLDFEDDLAYEYDSYELDAAAADADIGYELSDDEFDRVEDEADEILRRAAGGGGGRGGDGNGGDGDGTLRDDLLNNS